jgi:hypothetical protein
MSPFWGLIFEEAPRGFSNPFLSNGALTLTEYRPKYVPFCSHVTVYSASTVSLLYIFSIIMEFPKTYMMVLYELLPPLGQSFLLQFC